MREEIIIILGEGEREAWGRGYYLGVAILLTLQCHGAFIRPKRGTGDKATPKLCLTCEINFIHDPSLVSPPCMASITKQCVNWNLIKLVIIIIMTMQAHKCSDDNAPIKCSYNLYKNVILTL